MKTTYLFWTVDVSMMSSSLTSASHTKFSGPDAGAAYMESS